MNFLSKIKKNMLYLFLALPLILIGYESFMSLALGSRTWSFLLIGQIALVPFAAYIFHFLYNTIGQQTTVVSLLYYLLACIPVFVYLYILTNPTALGGASFSIPSISIPSIQAPSKEQVDSGFRIFGIVSIPIIVVLSVGLLVFPEQFVGLFSSISKGAGATVTNAIKFPFESLFNMFKNNEPVVGDDVCSILPGNFDSISKVPSFYLSHIAFFMGYLLTNAFILFSKVKESDSDEKAYNSRHYRSLMIMITLIVLYIILAVVRSNTSNCESSLGIFFSTSVFSSLGLAWYLVARFCGCRSADLFGIESSMVSEKAKSPVVCLNPTTTAP
uniref:Uncharacterized protein n=1 Tax=viral metagenome TaxID=1070528 RepID=A0A6C0D6T6_9ZZZZ